MRQIQSLTTNFSKLLYIVDEMYLKEIHDYFLEKTIDDWMSFYLLLMNPLRLKTFSNNCWRRFYLNICYNYGYKFYRSFELINLLTIRWKPIIWSQKVSKFVHFWFNLWERDSAFDVLASSSDSKDEGGRAESDSSSENNRQSVNTTSCITSVVASEIFDGFLESVWRYLPPPGEFKILKGLDVPLLISPLVLRRA